MRAYFELNDKGTCNRFTLIKGVQKTHTFIKKDNGGSRLDFDGTPAQFELLMRDIYGVISPSLRTKAIFIHVEVPDVSALETKVMELIKERELLIEANADLQSKLSGKPAAAVTHPFPLSVPKRASAQPDVGLPVGPGAPVKVKGIATPTVTRPKVQSEDTKAKRRATWAKKKAEAQKPKATKPRRKQPANA